MKDLLEQCLNCTKCELYKTRTKLVFGKGNENADLLFIGEAPGRNEDLQGEPFVGAAGKKLDEFLNKINLSLKEIYIANILKCRPPNNRDPLIQEIKACTPYLVEQIKRIKPKVICTLGNYATKFVLSNFNPDNMQKISGITKLHGRVKFIELDNYKIKVIPIFHPAAILYKPNLINDFDKDFQIIKAEINKKEDHNKEETNTNIQKKLFEF